MSLEKFHYEHGDKKLTLTKFKHVPVGVIRKLRGQNEAEQIFGIIEAVADAKALAVIDEMTTEDLQALIAAWQADSKVTLGESSASAK